MTNAEGHAGVSKQTLVAARCSPTLVIVYTRQSRDASRLFQCFPPRHSGSGRQDMLFNLAEAADLSGKRIAMFNGEKINNTEGRAVMHVALRAPKDAVGLSRRPKAFQA